MGRGAVPPFLSAVAEVCIVRGDSLFTPSRSDHSARLRHIVCLQSRRLRPTCCSPHCRAEPSAQSLSTERKAWGSLSLKMRMRRFHKDTLYFYIWRIGTHMKNVFTVSSERNKLAICAAVSTTQMWEVVWSGLRSYIVQFHLDDILEKAELGTKEDGWVFARDPILPVVGPTHFCPGSQISKHGGGLYFSSNFKVKWGIEKCLYYYSPQNVNILNIKMLKSQSIFWLWWIQESVCVLRFIELCT